MNDYSIEVSELRKSYGTLRAVDGISFTVEKGQVFGMLGPNGAGKSTTIEMLVGLRTRDSGAISILGLDPAAQTKELKYRIGVQLQTPSLYPKLTVREVVRLFGSFYPRRLPAEEVIERVGLTEKKNTQVSALSGGQMHRLAIAIAMVNDGEVVFLDEPTTGLDPQARRNLWDVISQLRERGKTVFLSTHYMDEAERLCDRLVVVDHGKIIAQGSPKGLIDEYFKDRAIEFTDPPLADPSFLPELPGASKVDREDDKIIVYSSEVPSTISRLMELASSQGTPLEDLSVRQATLEDVFLKLTGRRIRE